MHGRFDFNQTPIAPPGILVLIHSKPTQHGLWSPHAQDAWYLGPALDSYQCFHMWVWETRQPCITDTLQWFPTKTTVPTIAPVNIIVNALANITKALQTEPGQQYLSDPTVTNALKDVQTVLHPPIPQPLRVGKPGGSTNKAKPPATTTPGPTEPTTRRVARSQTVDTNYKHVALHSTAINPNTGNVAKYYELSQCSNGKYWTNSNAQEIGRLAQGLGPNSNMPTGTNTIFFIPKNQIPAGRKVTYLRIICADCPEKPEPRRVRWTASGDRVEYPFPTTAKTADMSTVKTHLNSIISTNNVQYLTTNLKDFLETPMERYEYLRIPVKAIPKAVYEYYNLHLLEVNGYVCAKVRKGMCGLPQAGKIANDQLIKF